MTKTINLYFEEDSNPSIVLSKENDKIIIDFRIVRLFTEEETSLLSSSIKTLLGQEQFLKPIEKIKLNAD